MQRGKNKKEEKKEEKRREKKERKRAEESPAGEVYVFICLISMTR
jgi:hypothetical protein|tara:strand:- start:389 stop:523 length:135 start_codon:yes stop_codon:yes gene_type:complete